MSGTITRIGVTGAGALLALGIFAAPPAGATGSGGHGGGAHATPHGPDRTPWVVAIGWVTLLASSVYILRDKPDGVIGPMTRAAIRSFQKNAGARETGEPTKDLFAALQEAVARRDAAAGAPAIDLGQPEPPPAPPTSADIARTTPKPD